MCKSYDFTTVSFMYYNKEHLINQPTGNNALSFEERKKIWSDCIVRIPRLKMWTLDDVRFDHDHVAYEYVNEQWELVSSTGLQDFLQSDYHWKDLTIIDNHNHAFSMWQRSLRSGVIQSWATLLHLDQHSDMQEPVKFLQDFFPDQDVNSLSLEQIDQYTNHVLTIADFIKAAKGCGLIDDIEIMLTEYSLDLLDSSLTSSSRFSEFSEQTSPQSQQRKTDYILDIDLDFRAPEMGIQDYDKTIKQVRNMIFHPQTKVITIATSPTYIEQDLALQILHDILR